MDQYPEIRTDDDGVTYCSEHGGLGVRITLGQWTGRRMAECDRCGAYRVLDDLFTDAGKPVPYPGGEAR